MQSESYRRKLLFLWQVRLTLFYLPFAALLSAAMFALKLEGKPIFGILLAAVWIIALFVLLPAYIKRIELLVLKKVLKVGHGLFFRTAQIIPFSKIIYIKIYKTPILGAFGLVGVLIKTVGGTVILPEIGKRTAALLKLRIKEAQS